VGSGSGLKGGGCIRKEDHHLWGGAGLVIGRLLWGRAKDRSVSLDKKEKSIAGWCASFCSEDSSQAGESYKRCQKPTTSRYAKA
jgi:hypothetical protein